MFDLESVDVDDAVTSTRSEALGRAAVFGGGLLGGGALLGLLAPVASAASLAKGDVAILNYALTLEYLEAAFYTEAEEKGKLSGELATFAKVVGAHERAHVTALKKTLGSKAVKKPKFNFHGTTTSAKKFAATAEALEDTGVSAYKGQAALIKSNAVLQAALAIHAVEARHAAWIRYYNGTPPAPGAFDAPASMKAVLKAVGKTKFIVG